MITDIDKFTQDVKKMRDAQNAYFKARKDPNTPQQDIWSLLKESRKLEAIVDKQLEEEKPEEPQLFYPYGKEIHKEDAASATVLNLHSPQFRHLPVAPSGVLQQDPLQRQVHLLQENKPSTNLLSHERQHRPQPKA